MSESGGVGIGGGIDDDINDCSAGVSVNESNTVDLWEMAAWWLDKVARESCSVLTGPLGVNNGHAYRCVRPAAAPADACDSGRRTALRSSAQLSTTTPAIDVRTTRSSCRHQHGSASRVALHRIRVVQRRRVERSAAAALTET